MPRTEVEALDEFFVGELLCVFEGRDDAFDCFWRDLSWPRLLRRRGRLCEEIVCGA